MKLKRTLEIGLCTIFAFPACVVLSGCQAAGEHERTALTDGEQAYRSRDYRRAVDQSSVYLQKVHSGSAAARAYYIRGLAEAMLGQRFQAYSDLQRALSSGDPEVTWQPAAALGVMNFEDDRFDTAIQLLGQAVGSMPADEYKAAVLYRLGMAYERWGRWAAAQQTFSRLVRDVPLGKYGGLAQRRLTLRADHFAIQCGTFTQAANAHQLAAELRAQGLSASVSSEQRNGAAAYTVLEGRYASYPQALWALSRVKGYVPDAVLWPG